MPRPRIRPEERQRAMKACRRCQKSKKRCDSNAPCGPCQKKDCASTCTYSNLEPHTSSAQRTRARSSVSQIANTQPTERSYVTPEDNGHSEIALQQSLISPAQDLPESPEAAQLKQGRMLLNSKGERVHVGNAGHLSFLHFLRQTISQHMGPTTFTESQRQNVMLEAELAYEPIADADENMNQKRVLVEFSFIATSGLIDIFTHREMSRLLQASESRNLGHSTSAALYLSIAIGGQSRATEPTDLQYASKYFSLGQKAAFNGMLEDPSVDLVRSFLLMAFYMLGACRRNAAYMYLGVAMRAAHAMGLYVPDHYAAFDRNEQNTRLRTWKSLQVFELLVSSMLGRPSASAHTQFDTTLGRDFIENSGVHRSQTLSATYEACSIMSRTVQDISRQKQSSVDTAEKYLELLGIWSKSLPPEMREFQGKSIQLSTDQEVMLGNMNVACIYYFAVMLVTRPFLVDHLTKSLSSRGRNSSTNTVVIQLETAKSKLAEASIDAAVYMAKTCMTALQANLLLNNMCLLKAWLFAAGLVLGFAIFTQSDTKADLEEAFSNVRVILSKLSTHSPQAEQYYEVLNSFNDAIIMYRQQMASERRRTSNRYVNQILSFDDKFSNTSRRGRDETSTTEQQNDSWWTSGQLNGSDGREADQNLTNWDNFAFQIFNNFPYPDDLSEGPLDLFG